MTTLTSIIGEKGMVYNPQTFRWEGNENTISQFDIPPLETPTPSHHKQSSYMDGRHGGSPSRPALIAPISTGNGHNVQVQNGMVYDPQQMKWLKVKGGRDVSGQLSPSVTDGDEEEDAFAGIEDLKDENAPFLGTGSMGVASPAAGGAQGLGEVHEEFDLGPRFISLQKQEEENWVQRCRAWFVPEGDELKARPDDGRWRWILRDMVSADSLDGF